MSRGNSRISINLHGNLIIRGVIKDDSGDYVCEVKNQHGTDRAHTTVLVIKEPEIISKPRHEVFQPGIDASFDCELKVC